MVETQPVLCDFCHKTKIYDATGKTRCCLRCNYELGKKSVYGGPLDIS